MPHKDRQARLEYQKEYQRKWRLKNPERVKEINKKSESRPERKEYIKKWWGESDNAKQIRKRHYENGGKQKMDVWVKKNPERVKEKYSKYYNTTKGVVNYLKKRDRKKFNIRNPQINTELINFVNERDKVCPYCEGEFKPRPEYDHINPFKPISKENVVKCCSRCNQSKNNSDLIQWLNFKNYKITEKIVNLYKNAYDLE